MDFDPDVYFFFRNIVGQREDQGSARKSTKVFEGVARICSNHSLYEGQVENNKPNGFGR